jgi:hypothetical protein
VLASSAVLLLAIGSVVLCPAIIEGQRIYYNHIRPHQGLNGKTPAEAGGIKLAQDLNRWESLIRQLVKPPRESAVCLTNLVKLEKGAQNKTKTSQA